MKPLHLDAKTALIALALFGLASCTSPADGYRDDRVNPDVRLLSLVDTYQRGKWESKGERGSAVVDPRRAAHEIEKLALEFPHHVPTLFTVAAIAFEEGGREKAASYLDVLFYVQPVHPEAGVLRSRIAIADGNLPAAERVLRQQIRYTPDHAGLREALGAVLFLAGSHADARAELEVAGRLGAPSARIAFNQGLVSESEGQFTAAAGYYAEALEAEPGFAQAASRLAGLRAEAGEVVRP